LAAGVDEEEEVNAPTLSLCYLALLTSSMSSTELGSFVQHLRISNHDARLLHEVMRLRESIVELQARAMLPSSLYRLLHPFSREARFVFSVLTDAEVVLQRLDLYEQELVHVAPHVDGHYLKSLGVPPGPIYGEILARIRDALLDQQLTALEEECELARSLVRASQGKLASG
jgi:tRNA nucleotidyltransferase (CCA-adding enzyme)